ncbi:MAG TPA: hypothetical protein VGQ83_14850 [Polyangia bacterium]|jgi:hypothetical protein
MRNVDDLYELARQLPAGERLRLVERIVHDLSAGPAAGERFDWSQLAGVAPGLSGGDAQAWVSRAREESERRQHGPRGR